MSYEIIFYGQPKQCIALCGLNEEPETWENGKPASRHVGHVAHERHISGPTGMKKPAWPPIVNMNLREATDKIKGQEVC